MYLHFDSKAFKNELQAVLSAFTTSREGLERHADLSKKLLDPSCSNRKGAKFSVAANCANCVVSVVRAVHVIWENGIPVQVSLLEDTCPHCNGKTGFHFKSVESLHA